jgi:hypothetical protein
MFKKLILAVVIISLILLGANTPSKASGINVWKTEKDQTISKDRWTTMIFGDRKEMAPIGPGRTLYCSQIHMYFPNKKPRWVKLRLGRELPNGKLDTTGTNTWTLGKNAPEKWQGAVCWPINTEYPMTIQVKFGGGPSKVVITQKQYKAWNPGVDIPDEVLVFD